MLSTQVNIREIELGPEEV